MSKHDDPGSQGAAAPLVTYSRVPRRRAPKRARAVAEPFPDERTEPHLTAAEVPFDDDEDLAGGPPLRAANDYFGEAPIDSRIDPLEPPQRRRSRLGFVALIAVVAVILGVGVLALTFGLATNETDRPAAGTVPATGIDPARLDAASESGDTLPAVRNIPLGEGDVGGTAVLGSSPESSTASAPPQAPVPPPVPRARPEADTLTTAPTEPAPGEAPLALPDQPAAATAKAAQPESDDEFISRIERTLSTVPEAPARRAPAAEAPATVFTDPAPAAPPTAELAPTLVPQDGLDIAPPPGTAFDLGPDAGAPLDLNPPEGAFVPPADIPNAPANGFQ